MYIVMDHRDGYYGIGKTLDEALKKGEDDGLCVYEDYDVRDKLNKNLTVYRAEEVKVELVPATIVEVKPVAKKTVSKTTRK